MAAVPADPAKRVLNLVRVEAGELHTLANAVLSFASLSLALEMGNMKLYDGALTALQRKRDFLARFSEAAVAAGLRSPIEALDFMAKKQFNNLPRAMDGILCATVAIETLQAFLVGYLVNIKSTSETTATPPGAAQPKPSLH